MKACFFFVFAISALGVAATLAVALPYIGSPGGFSDRHAPSSVPLEADVAKGSRLVVCDFGVVSPGKALEKAVLIQNDGPENLALVGVETSCGCAIAKLSSDVIAPDGEVEVRIAYTPPVFATTDERRVRLSFAGGRREVYDVFVRAVVRPELSVVPNRLRVERSGGDSALRQAVVYNHGEAVWERLEVTSLSGMVEITRVVPLSSSLLPEGAIEGHRIDFELNESRLSLNESAFDDLCINAVGPSGPLSSLLPIEIYSNNAARLLPSCVAVDADRPGSRTFFAMLPSEHSGTSDTFSVRDRESGAVLPCVWESLGHRKWKVKIDFSLASPSLGDGRAVIELVAGTEAVADLQLNAKGSLP